LREKQKLWVFENSLLRKIFGPKRDDVTGELGRLHNEPLHGCNTHQILFGLSNQEERDGRGMLNLWETIKLYIGIRWRDVKKGGHLKDLGVDRRTILRLIFKEEGEETWTDLI
jgi:hypothetical protein